MQAVEPRRARRSINPVDDINGDVVAVVVHQYDVVTKFKIVSKNKASGDPMFVLELDYGGVFHIEGVPQDQMHPFLLIE